jgi:hypothetical protein
MSAERSVRTGTVGDFGDRMPGAFRPDKGKEN